MLKPCHQQGFALKPVAEMRVGRYLFVHDLDDDLSAQVQLAGQIDAAHAAFAQLAERFISAKKNTAHHALSTPGV